MPAGRVVSTDPEPGAQVLDGGTVTVALSLGPERYDVPKLKGMTVDEAQDALADTNLAFGTTVEKWSDTVPAGVVIGSTPKAGETSGPTRAVDLIVSRGPKPVEIRSWVGKDADDAIAWLESKGLDGKVVGEEFSDTIAEGDVISQDPTGRYDAAPRRHGRARRLEGARADRGARRSSPRASRPRPRSSRTWASRSSPRRPPATSASATSSRRPRRRRERPRGSTITLSLI